MGSTNGRTYHEQYRTPNTASTGSIRLHYRVLRVPAVPAAASNPEILKYFLEVQLVYVRYASEMPLPAMGYV